jgi:hypothetical protein
MLDEYLGAGARAMLLLLVGDYEELDSGVAPDSVQVLDGVHHGRESTLHIVDAAAIEFATLLVRVELPLLARHHVGVAVQEYARLARAHADHEGDEILVRAGAFVPGRLHVPRLEPAVDEVDRGAGDAGCVRPEAYKPPCQGE